MARGDKAVQAENADKAAKNTEPKRTRTVLTPAQRIEKAKADLAALEAKVNERAEKEKTVAREKRAALVTKRDALNDQISALDATIGDDETPAEPVTDES